MIIYRFKIICTVRHALRTVNIKALLLHVERLWGGGGGQGQRHTRNQQKPSGNDIYGLISLNYIGKRNRTEIPKIH